MAVGIGRAKTIFFGEHFVVYGCKAIGFGLDKKIKVEVKKAAKMKIDFVVDEKIEKALEVLKRSLGTGNFEIGIKSSEIPVASGLGSSVAFNVATARALSEEFGLGLTDQKICDLAFETEKIFHGTPSGIDNTLSTFGGSILFQKRPGKNLIQRLKIGSPLHLVMIHSGVKGETKEMVEKVGIFKRQNEEIFSQILNIESKIVDGAVASIEKGGHERLGALMDINHTLLRMIGVSSPENEKIVSIAKENGALGAKIIGAGGGGFCIALMKDEKDSLKLVEIMEKQYRCFYNLVSAADLSRQNAKNNTNGRSRLS